MSIEDVHQSLSMLHQEIEHLDTPDASVKTKLLTLIEEVEKQLQNPESLQHRDAAVQKLPGLIEQFEADHPRMTDALGRLLTTLSGMGV